MRKQTKTAIAQQASAWRAEKLAELQTRIKIQESLLASLRGEYMEVDGLAGSALVMQFGWEKPEEVERIAREAKSWISQLEDLFIEGIWKGTWSSLFGTKKAA